MEKSLRRQRTMLHEQPFPAAADTEPPPPASATIASSSSSSNVHNLPSAVRQEEDIRPLYQRRRGASVSLGTALACERQDLPPALLAGTRSASFTSAAGRTLFDIIRDEEAASGGGPTSYGLDGDGSESGGHKISWRTFKERLRLRRASTAWQRGAGLSVEDLGLTFPVPSSEHRALEDNTAGVAAPLPRPNPSAAEAGRPPTPAVRSILQCEAPSVGQQQQGESNSAASADDPAGDQPPQPVRVSLMALLEETDRHGDGPGFAVSSLLEAAGEVPAEEEEDDEGGDGDGGKIYVKCCVCMVRHKGAAFIPCGHTFCRLCSRELWVSRGNCPLCNGFILEILDIF